MLYFPKDSDRNLLTQRNRSSPFEIEEVDQILFRLDQVKSGDAIIKRDQRLCCVATLDDRPGF